MRYWFKGGLIRWLSNWCWLLVEGFHYSPCGLDTGLLECPHGMAANFPRKSNPTEQGKAPMAFMAYLQKSHIVVLTIGHTVQLWFSGEESAQGVNRKKARIKGHHRGWLQEGSIFLYSFSIFSCLPPSAYLARIWWLFTSLPIILHWVSLIFLKTVTWIKSCRIWNQKFI